MKQTLLFTLLVISIQLMAQNLEPQGAFHHLSFLQNAPNRTETDIRYHAYPDQGFSKMIRHQTPGQILTVHFIDSIYQWKWDTANLEWRNNFKVADLIYDAGNNLTGYTYQFWNGVAWYNVEKYTFTFDANGNRTSQFIERWNTFAWVNVSQSMYSYDANNNLISVIDQLWNGNAWENDYKYTSVYDVHNNETY